MHANARQKEAAQLTELEHLRALVSQRSDELAAARADATRWEAAHARAEGNMQCDATSPNEPSASDSVVSDALAKTPATLTEQDVTILAYCEHMHIPSLITGELAVLPIRHLRFAPARYVRASSWYVPWAAPDIEQMQGSIVDGEISVFCFVFSISRTNIPRQAPCCPLTKLKKSGFPKVEISFRTQN